MVLLNRFFPHSFCAHLYDREVLFLVPQVCPVYCYYKCWLRGWDYRPVLEILSFISLSYFHTLVGGIFESF